MPPGDAVTADILRNYVVATSTNDGILVRNFSSSTTATTLSARIVDNVVTGETAQAGLSAAIGVLADGSQPISVQLINNTVAYNEVGIGVSARTEPQATGSRNTRSRAVGSPSVAARSGRVRV